MNNIVAFFILIVVQWASITNGDTDYIHVPTEDYEGVRNAMNFEGKVVLITGSSSGIGAETARLFSYLGARVVVTGRNRTRINEVVRDCQNLSPKKLKPLGLELDLTICGNPAKLVNATINAYNKIDILFNNAGIGLFATIQDPSYLSYNQQLRAINEDVQIEMSHLTAPYIQSSNGTVIFTASILARNPVYSTSGYSMSKNAMIALAQAMANDLGPYCSVNLISPGIVDGTRIFRLLPDTVRPLLIKNSIASSTKERASVPLDIAKLVVFLSSTLASSINGQELHADQGAYIPLL